MEVKSAGQDSEVVEKRKDSSKVYFFIIAIASLLLTNVYFYVKFKSSGEKLYTVTLEKESLQIEIDRIEAELDNFKNQVATMPDKMLASENEARKIIADLRKSLDNSSITEEQLDQARKQILQLKSNVGYLKDEIVELKMQNDLLEKENQLLSTQVKTGTQYLEEMAIKNRDLNDKVNVASSIKVSNIQVNGVEIKRKGNREIETRAKRVEELQIKFTIADNPLAKIENKEIFFRVIDPQGNLIAHASNVFYVHGDVLQFSFKESIQFTNRGEEYQFSWKDTNQDFKKGAYTVLLYAEDAIMGRSSIVLK